MKPIILSLEDHCIETALRKEFERSLGSYLEEEDPALLPGLELARAALQSLDFPALRSQDPELAGGSGVQVRISKRKGRLVVDKLARE